MSKFPSHPHPISQALAWPSVSPGRWAPGCCRGGGSAGGDPVTPAFFREQGPLVCVPDRRHTLTHTHGHTLLPKSFWGVNIKSGYQLFFFFLNFIDLYLLLLSETNCWLSTDCRLKTIPHEFTFSLLKGADSLSRESFSFSDEKLNSPTAAPSALPTGPVTPRKGESVSRGGALLLP